jgi:hypothetical protein
MTMWQQRFALIPAVALGSSNVVAEDWLIGWDDPDEVVTLTADRAVDGDITILNQGKLIVDGAELSLTGVITMVHDAQLEVLNGRLRFVQNRAYAGELGAYDNAQLRFRNAVVDGSGHSFSYGLATSATADYDNVTVENGFCTWALFHDAAATLSDCTNAGEFVMMGQGTVTIEDTAGALIWATFPEGSTGDLAFPSSNEVEHWLIGPASPDVTGVPYTVELHRCSEVLWAIMCRSGSDVVVRESELRLAGFIFERDRTVDIRGIANEMEFGDRQLEWGDIRTRLTDTSVQSWNFYAWGQTEFRMESCVVGEIHVAGEAVATVQRTLCDGTGGYVGTFDQGYLVMSRSSVLSQLTTSNESTCIVHWSSVLGDAVDALDKSAMLFVNADHRGEPRAWDMAEAFIGSIDPAAGTAGDTIPVTGSSRMITGPQSPFMYEGYRLDYGEGEEPTEWVSIADEAEDPIDHGQLGLWDTTGLAPGPYSLRLSVLNNIGDPMLVTTRVVLSEPGAVVGDLDGDGDVDLSDLGILLASFEVDDGGDVDGDGDTDLADLGMLLAVFEG